MADYIANGPISATNYIPNVDADIDLNGMKFSYAIGMFYTPESTTPTLKLPPPFQAGT